MLSLTLGVRQVTAAALFGANRIEEWIARRRIRPPAADEQRTCGSGSQSRHNRCSEPTHHGFVPPIGVPTPPVPGLLRYAVSARASPADRP